MENTILTYNNPTFKPTDWDNGTYSIQKWLERTPWRTLQNTHYGRSPEESHIPELLDDPLLRQVYLLDIVIFIAAERHSVDTCAKSLLIAPDEQSYLYLATQVLDEARHYEVFCRRLADFGITPEKREQMLNNYVKPGFGHFFDLISEQVDKGDFFAATLAQNIVLEGMAYPIYRYEMKYWSRIDPNLSKIIRGAFADEAHHVSFGEAVIGSYVKSGDHQRRNQVRTLMRQFSGLMREAYDYFIHHYIGLYQECANTYADIMNDIEIFDGRTMSEVTEEEQVRILLNDIDREHQQRLSRMGIDL